MWPKRSHKSAKPKEEASDSFDEATAEPIPDHRNAFIMIGLGGAVVVCFGLGAIAGIAAPVFFALVLTICVHPLRVWLERHGVSRGIATGSVIIAVMLLLVAFGYAVLVAFGQFGQLLPQFQPQIQAWLKDVASWLSSIGITSSQIQAIGSSFNPSAVIGFVGGLVGGLTGWITWVVIVFTMLLLMAMDAGFSQTLLRQLKPRRPLLAIAIGHYAHSVRRYMVVTTLLGLAQGFLNWIALLILQVPGAFIWALLSFLCSFIPNIGYFIAIIPPIVFGGLVGGWPTVIAVIIIYGVVNAGVQSVVQPRVVGNAVSLSQTLTFFSVLFWAVILGPLGAILAIPLTLLVRLILVDTNPATSWIRPLLGDLDETKAIMSASDAEQKAQRAARRAQRRTPAASGDAS
ncbi:MAG: AI-2E family transporter [Humibacter sp.]